MGCLELFPLVIGELVDECESRRYDTEGETARRLAAVG